MFTVMVVFHTLVCILLMIVVLMQSAKGEGLAGAFGGGGTGLTGAVFGGRGAASFLSKATTILAIVFMINCGVLAFMSSHRSGRTTGATPAGSVVTEEAQKEMERQAAQQQSLPADDQGGTLPSDQSTNESDLPAVPTGDETGQ
ncbi:MAG: preprotein translocase subunit SecG [Candidatus Zixiibacteriota bacterium]